MLLRRRGSGRLQWHRHRCRPSSCTCLPDRDRPGDGGQTLRRTSVLREQVVKSADFRRIAPMALLNGGRRSGAWRYAGDNVGARLDDLRSAASVFGLIAGSAIAAADEPMAALIQPAQRMPSETPFGAQFSKQGLRFGLEDIGVEHCCHAGALRMDRRSTWRPCRRGIDWPCMKVCMGRCRCRPLS